MASPYVFYIKDFSNDKVITDATVTVYKNINGSSTEIYSGLTDLQGTVSVYMNYTGVYSVKIEKSGYTTVSGVLNTLISPQVFNFYLKPSIFNLPSINLTLGIQDFSVKQKFYPENTFLTNNDYQEFWFYVSNNNSLLQNVSIQTVINGTVYFNQSINPFINNVTLATFPNTGDVFFNVNFTYKLVNKSTVTKTVKYFLKNSTEEVGQVYIDTGLKGLKDSFSLEQRFILVGVTSIIVVILLAFIVPFSYGFIAGMFIWGMFLLNGWFDEASFIVGILLVVGLVFLITKGDGQYG
jgi:hypothetical protein